MSIIIALDILYYNENYNNKSSDKPYIVVVVCLLVGLQNVENFQ